MELGLTEDIERYLVDIGDLAVNVLAEKFGSWCVGKKVGCQQCCSIDQTYEYGFQMID